VETTSGGFDEWFLDLHPRVLGAVQRLLASRVAAEDVVAEAFARALVRWPTVRSLAHRDAWLFRVATNLALDTLRRRTVRPDRILPSADAEHVGAELRMLLVPALRRLSRRQREAVVLRYVGLLSEQEVSAALGVSVETVRTHLKRGLAVLRSDPMLRDQEMIHVLPAG
jgi:RNA polymerase sigma-70 factor (ECF subfamily)